MADKRAASILLVSHFAPSRAHAGGLRILDIYALIRERCPGTRLNLYTHCRPGVDWSMSEAQKIFDNIYLSPVEILTPEGFESLRDGQKIHYDTIDLQYHPAGRQIKAFRRLGSKIIYTPMESFVRALPIEILAVISGRRRTTIRNFLGSIYYALEEASFAFMADQTVCVSESDAAALRRVTPNKRVSVLETGLSAIEFDDDLKGTVLPVSPGVKPRVIIYVAFFDSDINRAALRWYLDNVHPLVLNKAPGYVLKLVGRGDLSEFAPYASPSVDFIGEVPAIAPLIAQARVGIAPALSGSGLRGKVNQYAIMGVPCVVSPIAFAGLAYKDEESIFVASDPEMFAKRCVQLLTDDGLSARMATNAHKVCLERYVWAAKWRQISAIYDLGENDAERGN
ncbi:MAG: glycosyltransferase family 4 protein [Alphaproteobacteria bacterium]|nr:glycosyltransferase family 4 protein [Alphaproteobacteria bacterium]